MQLVLQRGKADVLACVSCVCPRVLACHNDVAQLDLYDPIIGFEGCTSDSLHLLIKNGSRERSLKTVFKLLIPRVLTQSGRLSSNARNVTAAHLVRLPHTQPSYLILTSDLSWAAHP